MTNGDFLGAAWSLSKAGKFSFTFSSSERAPQEQGKGSASALLSKMVHFHLISLDKEIWALLNTIAYLPPESTPWGNVSQNYAHSFTLQSHLLGYVLTLKLCDAGFHLDTQAIWSQTVPPPHPSVSYHVCGRLRRCIVHHQTHGNRLY